MRLGAAKAYGDNPHQTPSPIKSIRIPAYPFTVVELRIVLLLIGLFLTVYP